MSGKAMRNAVKVNGWIIPAAAVIALDRFNPGGPTGYRAVEPWAVDAPIRATREEAMADVKEGKR